MKKIISTAIIFSIFVFGLLSVTAQPTSPPTDLSGGPFFERPAPQDIIEKAETHIVGFLGEEHFNSHFSIKDSFKVLNYSYAYGVEYSYKIPYEHVGISAKKKS